MEIFCPAKVNLLLAVTGRRPDGYHELLSVMAPLEFGDRLRLTPAAAGERGFTCTEESLPMDEENLVVRAARLFEERNAKNSGYHLHLEKRIPVGAGLGGGSSDAAGALKLLNLYADRPFSSRELAGMAASLGADCPFFLNDGAMIARGAGERLEAIPATADARLSGTELLLLKPSFGVPTGWAYRRMAERKSDYSSPRDAERRLQEWIESGEPVPSLLFNNMQPAVFEKYISLAVLHRQLSALGGAVLMSGSGSTLIVVDTGSPGLFAEAEEIARKAWGASAWITRTRIAPAG